MRRRPLAGWPPGSGLALGLVLGMLLGVLVGRLLDLRALGFVAGLALGVVLGLLLDDGRGASDRQDGGDAGVEDEGGGEEGSIARALLWLALGLLTLVVTAAAIAPELLAAPGRLSDVLLLVLLAGVPGTVLLLTMITRRRRIDRASREEDR
ncbi:MAG: hypothetical protein ACLFUG_01695 [Nitriliruptoraceae bacterium]